MFAGSGGPRTIPTGMVAYQSAEAAIPVHRVPRRAFGINGPFECQYSDDVIEYGAVWCSVSDTVGEPLESTGLLNANNTINIEFANTSV